MYHFRWGWYARRQSRALPACSLTACPPARGSFVLPLPFPATRNIRSKFVWGFHFPVPLVFRCGVPCRAEMRVVRLCHHTERRIGGALVSLEFDRENRLREWSCSPGLLRKTGGSPVVIMHSPNVGSAQGISGMRQQHLLKTLPLPRTGTLNKEAGKIAKPCPLHPGECAACPL